MHTSTNVKMLVSLPTRLTLRQALPILQRKYSQVLEQDLPSSHHPTTITQITLNDCFIPLDEEVADVLSNNDELHVVVVS